MVAPLIEWHDEHLRFGRLLDLLATQVATFHAGQQPDYDLMRDIIHYLRHFADRFHHPREDVAFTRLAELDSDLRSLVDRLSQEHHVIAVAGEELLRQLSSIDTDVLIERASLEAAAATYLVYYRQHLATEEAEVLPRAAQLLTQHDWAAVTAAVPARADPLFGDDFEARYQGLRREIMLEAPEPPRQG